MGCGESKNKFDIVEMYAAANLEAPPVEFFQNDWERNIFMSINVLRYNPS